jgi:type IV pilus assembly protein PilM
MAKGPLVAVDLGQHSVKMLAMKRTRKGAVVIGAVSQAIGLPPKSSAEEIGQRSAEIIKALRKGVARGGRRVAVALSGRSAFSRHVKIPAVTGRQLNRIIRYEARQQIPFPIEQVNLDHHVVPSAPGAREVEVMLLAVRRDIASDLVSRLAAGGVRTDIVDVGPICLFNAYMATMGPAEGEVTAVISIGASSTDIVVEQGGQMRFMRSAPNAGNTLTEQLAKQLDVDWEEAERLKTLPASEYEKAEGKGPSAVDVATVLEEAFDSIVSDIRRSLDFYVSQPEASPVTRVVLCGGTARMVGVVEFLEDRLGVPVTLADFTASETLSWDVANRSEYAIEGILAGLAVHCGGKAALTLNVAPDSVKQRLDLERRAPMLTLCGLLLAGLLFAGFTGIQTCMDHDRQALERIQNVVNPTGLGPNQNELKRVRDEQIEFDRRFDKLSEVAKKQGLVTGRYLEVLSMVPDDVWLTTVDLASDRMTLQGKALNEQRLQEFISNLRLSPYLVDDQVALSSFVPAPDGSIEYKIEAKEFWNPRQEVILFISNLKKTPDLTLILATLTTNAAGPGTPPAVTDETPAQSLLTAVVGTYDVENPLARVAVLRKVYAAVEKSQIQNCDKIQLRFFDRGFNERARQEVRFAEVTDFYSGKRNEQEMVAALESGSQPPPATPAPTPTVLPEGMMGAYGYPGYGYPGGYGMPMGGM